MKRMIQNMRVCVANDNITYKALGNLWKHMKLSVCCPAVIKDCVIDFYKARLPLREKVLVLYQNNMHIRIL